MAKILALQQVTISDLVLATMTTAVNVALAAISADDIIDINFEVTYDSAVNNFVYVTQIVYKKHNDAVASVTPMKTLVTATSESTNLAAFNTAVNVILSTKAPSDTYKTQMATGWEDVGAFVLYACQVTYFKYNA